MPESIVTGPGDLARLVQAYRDAEAHILGLLRRAVERQASGSAAHYANQHRELQRLLRGAEAALNTALDVTNAEVSGLLAANYQAAAIDAVPGVTPPSINTAAVNAITLEAAGAVASVRSNVLRDVADAYRRITQVVGTRSMITGESRTDRLQAALNEYARRGITGFVDRSGRRWGIDTYAEMSLRTAVNRAQNQGRREQYQAHGIDLIVTSSHKGCSDLCMPYQGRILSMTGPAGPRVIEDEVHGGTVTVEVVATWQEAVAGGYKHPNAILGGDQSYQSIGETLAGSVGTYRGPAITIRTAKGNEVTVSPKHPVLTARGWLTAESVCEGDTLFRAELIDGSAARSGGGPDVNDVPTTVEQELVALKAIHPSATIPAAGHYFNDDRQFLEGEVHVVMPDHGLPVVPDTHVIEESGQVRFVWSGVEGLQGSGYRPEPFSPVGVSSPVGRALSDGDAGSFEAAAERRVGDSEVVSEVLAGVPGFVHTDEVVNVDRFTYEGHAYDFQTGSGMYVLQGIITHNCRHTETAYIGGTPLPTPVDTGEGEYRVEQQQRYLERGIREWKKQEAVATTPERRRFTRGKVREWQARQRSHLKGHVWLTRRYDREQVRTGIKSVARGVPPNVVVTESPFRA